MQAEIISIKNAEKIAKYDELVAENKQLKLDNAKLQEKYNLIHQENQMNIARTKEREKNYLKTNAEKENIACDWKDSCLENAGKIEILETQQKEFTKFLEGEIKELQKIKETELDYDILKDVMPQLLVFEDVLQKHKSIIGDDK